MFRRLADVADRAMDTPQQRLQADAKGVVIVRAAEPALSAKLHILYAARRAGQSRQLVRLSADVLADQRLQDGREVQFMLLDKLLRLGATVAEVQFFLLPLVDVGQVDRGRVGAELTLHAAFLLRL